MLGLGLSIWKTVLKASGLDPLAPDRPTVLTNLSANTDVTPTIRVTLGADRADGDVISMHVDGAQVGTDTLDATDVSNGYVDFTLAQLYGVGHSATARSTRTIGLTDHVSAFSPPLSITFDYVGVVFYGQSNNLNMFSKSSTPPAASEGTSCWDNSSAWGAVPSANGAREFANSLKTLTGKPIRMVYAGESGVPLAYLLDGHASGAFDTLEARLLASGIVAHYYVLNQGEGDADAGTAQAGWISSFSTLHQSVVDVMGRTKAQCPAVIVGIGRRTSGSGDTLDTNWTAQRVTQREAASQLSNVHYSHSNASLPMDDDYHWSAAGHATNGLLAARTIAFLRGDVATRPLWAAASAARVSATETDITVTHVMGTDFGGTTTGLTGFEITDDNGANWEVPSGAARQTATTIRLTHSDMGTVERKIRYQYGRNPTVTTPVLDNGTLTAPMAFTQAELTAEAATVEPVPTFVSSGTANTGSGGATQSRTSVAIGTRTETELFIVGITNACGGPGAPGIEVTSLKLKRSGESDVTFTIATQSARANAQCFSAIGYAEVDTAGTTGEFEVVFSQSPFNSCRIHVHRVPVSHLSSTTPVGSASKRSASSVTTDSVDISTSADGFIVACSTNRNAVSNSGDFTGSDEAITRRVNDSANGGQHIVGDVSDTTAQSGTNTVAVAFTQSAITVISAASWR